MPILATVTIESDTGVSSDRVSNSFAFDQPTSASMLEAEMSALADAVIGFYNSTPTGVDRAGAAIPQPLAYHLSPVLDIGANRSTVRLYDLPEVVGGLLGSPFYSKPFTLAGPVGAATPLPSEVAVVATLEAVGRADAQVELSNLTRPKSRRTGRLFIGPLNGVASTVQTGVARPSPLVQDTILQAVASLQAAAAAAMTTADLAVWSRADNVVRPLEAVSVDNAFDIQRRRGEKATARRRILISA